MQDTDYLKLDTAYLDLQPWMRLQERYPHDLSSAPQVEPLINTFTLLLHCCFIHKVKSEKLKR